VAGGQRFTVEGDLINRCEVFDEGDLDAAIARFRSAKPAGAAAGEHGKAGPTRATLRASTRTTWTLSLRFWPTTFAATIGGG